MFEERYIILRLCFSVIVSVGACGLESYESMKQFRGPINVLSRCIITKHLDCKREWACTGSINPEWHTAHFRSGGRGKGGMLLSKATNLVASFSDLVTFHDHDYLSSQIY